jgi:serine/threonine protein kinase
MATMAPPVCPACRAPVAPGARFCGACGSTIGPASHPATSAPAPGTLGGLIGRVVAGRYRVLSKLGAGGMGTVFRAEQVSVKRQIALKVLDPTVIANPELLRRFQAEAEVVARLSHPHTVTLFDFGQDESGILFIAMELVAGTGLRDVIAREAPLPPFRAVDIAEQVASSLADAHAHGIVHRDLKPDNVILQERAGRKDFARVLDFGIAKLFDEGQGTAMTRAGQLLGTPQYMAPEQIMGQPVDGRTDVYALGVMLYEMLAGRPPFEGQSLMELLAKHLHDPPPPIGRLRPGLSLPMPLERLLHACLAKDPAHRPPDMRTLDAELADLRSLLDPGPRRASQAVPQPLFTPTPTPTPLPNAHAHVPAPTPMPAAPPPPVRKPAAWPWVVVALVLAAGAATAIFFAIPRDGNPPAASTPSTPGPAGPPVQHQSSRLGYTLLFPAGLKVDENAGTGGVQGHGDHDGHPISIAVEPVGGDDDAGARARQIEQATAGSATIVERRVRRIRGTDLVSIVYDVARSGSRFETVFYPGNPTLAVTFAARDDYFDETAALRDSLFRDRFQPGAAN